MSSMLALLFYRLVQHLLSEDKWEKNFMTEIAEVLLLLKHL